MRLQRRPVPAQLGHPRQAVRAGLLKVLLHQGSAGIGGSAQDIAIQADDLRRSRDTVLGLISEDTGQEVATVERDSRRDRWFSADEALAYGFVDHIVGSSEDVLPGPRRPLGLGVQR